MEYETERQLRVSDLKAELESIRENHGNIPIFVYSSTEKHGMPLVQSGMTLYYSFSKAVFGQPERASALTISPSLSWVEDGIVAKLQAENEQLLAVQSQQDEHIIRQQTQINRLHNALTQIMQRGDSMDTTPLGTQRQERNIWRHMRQIAVIALQAEFGGG